ncbi:MAG: DUF362 domain-containing protein [Candidatus Riflebacteria bacterium]|nr:DUF362 domain-containing protein [Candidatus Riflebacteria bacterium]
MSEVFFTDLKSSNEESILSKLKKLVKMAGFEKINFKDKFTAIKIHFGEPGNMAFIRAQYARVIADLVIENGGKPFLTDCNTLYVGGRKNGIDHLESAYRNGFVPYVTGCHVIIADGLRGADEEPVFVGGEYVESAKIGKAIADADIVISMNHFKGHELTGMGGALKNLGMGSGSRAGKMEMHSSGKPSVYAEKCVGCGKCKAICAHDAIKIEAKKASINHAHCVGCGRCLAVCPMDAIMADFNQANDVLNKKIAEYAKAVISGKEHFHINFVVDVSPACDCHACNDIPIVSDVGIFASFDPVAIDVASAEAVNQQAVAPGSVLEKKHKAGEDYFDSVSRGTNWRVCTDYASKIGLGDTSYELIRCK